ncbi:MAG: hypothetical protein ABR562_06705 [Thermoplasmatota archaeon]
MDLRQDEAASPLMVIATFVLVASGVTALLFFAFVDTSPPSVSLQQVSDGAPAFKVVAEHGGLKWESLKVQFVDSAGADHADVYLEIPNGELQTGDRIALRSGLPAGNYLLRVFDGERELARLSLTV